MSEREKDALLTEQAALIERLVARVQALDARVAELEALLAKPKKTSQNSHTPPSQDRRPGASGDKKHGKRRQPRPSRPGSARPLSAAPDETIKRLATAVSALRRRRFRADAALPPSLRTHRHPADHPGGDAHRAVRRAPRRRTACRRAVPSAPGSARFCSICTTAITPGSSGCRG